MPKAQEARQGSEDRCRESGDRGKGIAGDPPSLAGAWRGASRGFPVPL